MDSDVSYEKGSEDEDYYSDNDYESSDVEEVRQELQNLGGFFKYARDGFFSSYFYHFICNCCRQDHVCFVLSKNALLMTII